MKIVKLLNLKFRVFVLLVLYACSADASETVTERSILNSIKEFGFAQMPLSFGKLWIVGIDNSIPYSVWQSIKATGDRYNVDWASLSFYDSYQKTIVRNGKSYKYGIVMFKVNKGDCLALSIFYLTDYNGRIVNMRDNWSRELSGGVLERAKDVLKQLVDRWL